MYRIFQSQGSGTCCHCKDLALAGLVFANGAETEGPDVLVDTAGLVLDVDGERWAYHARVYLILNKPAGVECSQKPKHHPSVYTLLSVPLCKCAVQCVGRLDQDTMGLLLPIDDGQSVHIITGLRHQMFKMYEITAAEPVIEVQIAQLYADVLLADENENVAAARAERVGTRHSRMAFTQGKYHRAKRMVAAAGSHVAGLHRSAIGGLSLGDLASGEWRWLGAAGLEALNTTSLYAIGLSA